MSLGYVLIRDGLMQNEVLVKYNLCNKALQVLLKAMSPQNLERWFTDAELRKNTQTLSSEMRIITSISVRIGFLKEQIENGKIKYKFNPAVLLLTEEQFNDSLRAVKYDSMPDDLLRILDQFDLRLLQKQRFGKGNRKIDKLVADDILTDEVRQQVAEITRPLRHRRSKIDDPETVAIYNAQKTLDAGEVSKKTAVELHKDGECDPTVCKFHLLGIEP